MSIKDILLKFKALNVSLPEVSVKGDSNTIKSISIDLPKVQVPVGMIDNAIVKSDFAIRDKVTAVEPISLRINLEPPINKVPVFVRRIIDEINSFDEVISMELLVGLGNVYYYEELIEAFDDVLLDVNKGIKTTAIIEDLIQLEMERYANAIEYVSREDIVELSIEPYYEDFLAITDNTILLIQPEIHEFVGIIEEIEKNVSKKKTRKRVGPGPWDNAPCTHLRWQLMGFFREKLAIVKTTIKVGDVDVAVDKIDVACTKCGTKMTLQAK